MVLSIGYGDFKLHEADAFELDHVIHYKKSSQFNLRNALMEVNLEIFLPRKLPTIPYRYVNVCKSVYIHIYICMYVCLYIYTCLHSTYMYYTYSTNVHACVCTLVHMYVSQLIKV